LATLPARALRLTLLLSLALAEKLSAQCPDGSIPPCGTTVRRNAPPIFALIPFQNRSDDASDNYLADALTEDLTGELVRSGVLRVTRDTARSQLVAYTLRGSVTRVSQSLQVALRVERAGGEVVWSSRLMSSTQEMASLSTTIAEALLGGLGLVSKAPIRLARRVDPAVYDLVLRGRYHLPRRTEADTRLSIEYYQRAIAGDSEFAPAWAGLGQALIWARQWSFNIPGIAQESLLSRALSASDRAIQLDSASSEAWLLRATVSRAVDPTNLLPALRATRRALALDSLSSAGWHAYGVVLGDSGDLQNAALALRRAALLDPDGGLGRTYLANLLYWQRRYPEAAAWADSGLVVNPTRMYAHEMAGEIALARGRLEEAKSHFSAALNLGTGRERIRALSGQAQVAAHSLDTVTARDLAAQAESLVRDVPLNNHIALSLAEAWIALNDTTRALAWLERYPIRGDMHFQLHLEYDASLDPLRAEPRFQRLLRSTEMEGTSPE